VTPTPSLSFDAIGTRWQIDSADPLGAPLEAAVRDRTEEFDRAWSRFRDDSLVHRISVSSGSFELPADAPALLELYRTLYECTDGAVTPLIGRALEQWGYDSAYSLRPIRDITPAPRWEDAISWDGRSLHTVRPVVLDVGAAGKGYLVDLVAHVLVDGGVTAFTIDASGDLLHHGGRPLRVALEHPLDPSKAIGVALLSDGALCASASNRRAWPGGHHLIDALTGAPTKRVIATWATASSCLVADGLATALFFGEPERLAREFDFEWVRMLQGGSLEHSSGFDGEIFA